MDIITYNYIVVGIFGYFNTWLYMAHVFLGGFMPNFIKDLKFE